MSDLRPPFLSPAPPDARHSAAAAGALVAIGNFDGVHLGHQALLRLLMQQARAAALQPVVLTFFPHPAVVLGRREQPVLTRLPHRIALLQSVVPGLQVKVQPFTRELAALSPEQFVRDVLLGGCQAQRVVVGENFRFGQGRQGDLSTLQALGQQLGFEAEALPLLAQGGEVISSSRIRALVTAGEVDQAAALLGRPHTLIGTVVTGQRLGRQLGFPTANLSEVQELLPANGVYACRVRGAELLPEGQPAVCNVGTRPTVAGVERRVEVHLLRFAGDLYTRQLQIELQQRLRDEQRFADVQALRAQIALDVAQAERVLA